MQLSLRRAYVRTLLDELGRHAHGQVRRQLERREVELLLWIVAGQTTRQGRQEVAVLLQLLLQRRQRLLHLGERGILRRHLEPGHGSELELAPHQFQ